MKKKLKLNFDQLEKEMGLQDNILTSPVDLSSISGGSNIYEIMAYFESLGFIFERGSDGNYYGSQCITLDPVTVTARVGSGNNVTNVPFDYGTTYGTHGIIGIKPATEVGVAELVQVHGQVCPMFIIQEVDIHRVVLLQLHNQLWLRK